jgi:para-nitrobenzyl esterase
MKQSFKFISGLTVIIVLILSCSGNEKDNSLLDPLVMTKYGQILGSVNDNGNVVMFKGIPYAAPPVGNLRWREPEPPQAWEGVRDASTFCASCVQVNNRRLPWTDEYMIPDTATSEDCLFLNIWTPAKSSADSLPVMFWIHGGGMREGSGSIEVYDGEELAKKGIIVVTINYRVGALGFLAHPWLTAESGHNASGNYGFMDQVAALKWVKENIAAFGGNPEKITITGQSAGSRSVHMLTASPMAKGLFTGAAVFSGASVARLTGVRTLADAEAAGVKFAEEKGARSLAELRAIPAKKLIADATITVDGWFFPVAPYEIFKNGQQNDVPTIAGLTADEGSSSADYGKKTKDAFIKEAKDNYGANAKEFLSLYPVNSDMEAGAASIEVAREKGRYDIYEWAKFRAATAKTPVYTYYFERGIPWPEHPEFGAHHTSDVTYWFKNLKKLDRPWNEADSVFAENVSSYLVNFVKTGDPNGEGLKVWPAFSIHKAETFKLNFDMEVIPVASENKLNFFSGK